MTIEINGRWALVRRAALLGCAALWSPSAWGQTQFADAGNVASLQRLSIEELAQVEVTSVSKRAERLSEAPAAVFVIGAEDIRRSGATTLPEVLRLAPNLQVQQLDAHSYAISARGFNGYESSNKLLVLIDGRTVYTPLHAAVYWDLHEPFLDDIERIEVVSGPGGTLYGPNAVNGVINIITRGAADTQGLHARAVVGNTERSAGLRYGGRLGGSGTWRAYATGFDREHQFNRNGTRAQDSWDGYQAGFRFDHDGGDGSFTFQGDIFDNDLEDIAGIDGGNKGHNLLTRWTRSLGAASSLQVQAYYDKFRRSFLLVSDTLETYDLQAQHNLGLGRHEIVWGAGVRLTSDEYVSTLIPFVLDPPSRRLWVGNLFAQDEIQLRQDVALTLGIKFERTSFTGIEVLPNVRLAWQADPATLVWGAISRAVRTPSRIDRQLVFPPILAANPDFVSEKLTAFEAGFRSQPTSRSSLSVSFYYNLYDDLRTTEFSPGGALPVMLSNGLEGRTFGVEAWGSYQLTDWWRLSAGVHAIDKDFDVKPGRIDTAAGASAGNDPDHQVMLRSQFNPTDDIDVDISARHVDNLPQPAVKAYTALDARLAWRFVPNVEVAVTGFNLLDKRRAESGDPSRGRVIRRRIQLGMRLAF